MRSLITHQSTFTFLRRNLQARDNYMCVNLFALHSCNCAPSPFFFDRQNPYYTLCQTALTRKPSPQACLQREAMFLPTGRECDMCLRMKLDENIKYQKELKRRWSCWVAGEARKRRGYWCKRDAFEVRLWWCVVASCFLITQCSSALSVLQLSIIVQQVRSRDVHTIRGKLGSFPNVNGFEFEHLPVLIVL